MKGAAIGGFAGGLIGGTVAGIDAVRSDASFWNGKVYESGGANFGKDGTFLNEEIPAGAKPTATCEISVTESYLIMANMVGQEGAEVDLILELIMLAKKVMMCLPCIREM